MLQWDLERKTVSFLHDVIVFFFAPLSHAHQQGFFVPCDCLISKIPLLLKSKFQTFKVSETN